MLKIVGIYKITSPSRRIYIGSTTDFDRRIYEYSILACRKQIRLYNSLKKYGFQNHKIEIIHECGEKELFALEAYYGNLFNVLDRKAGLNSRIPKAGEVYKAFSDETIAKMKLASKLRKPNPESVNKMIQSNIGRKHCKEFGLKISERQRGKKRGSEFSKTNSMAQKRYWDMKGRFSDEEKRKRAADATMRYRMNMTPEQKELEKIKRKERNKRLNKYPGAINNRKLTESKENYGLM